MGVHLERVHGLAPFLPEQSKEDWVYAQCLRLATQYAEAELAGDKQRQDRLWNSLIGLYTYHRDVFSIEYIGEIVAEERRRLDKEG